MNSERFSKALNWCVEEYKDDLRKSSGAPAVHHPLGVCDLVFGAGGDEDTGIGALFHDFGEDKGGEAMLATIESQFGKRVARIVRDCSDTLPSEYGGKEPWVGRKVEHIRHIPGLEDDSRLVLAADTLHNCRDHIRGIRGAGESWWSNFRANVYLDKERTPEIGAASSYWYLYNKGQALAKHAENKVLAHELTFEVEGLYELIKNFCYSEICAINRHMQSEYGSLY